MAVLQLHMHYGRYTTFNKIVYRFDFTFLGLIGRVQFNFIQVSGQMHIVVKAMYIIIPFQLVLVRYLFQFHVVRLFRVRNLVLWATAAAAALAAVDKTLTERVDKRNDKEDQDRCYKHAEDREPRYAEDVFERLGRCNIVHCKANHCAHLC